MKRMIFREELARITPILRDNPKAKIYVFGTGRYWSEYMYPLYSKLCGVDLIQDIYAFVDNDEKKQNQLFFNRPVISPNEMESGSIILVATTLYYGEVYLQLLEMGYTFAHHFFDSLYMDVVLTRFYFSETQKFRNKHLGQRCFILGNGASLTPEVFESLHKNNEISMVSSEMCTFFDKTPWRPSYYFIDDEIRMPTIEEMCSSESIRFLSTHLAADELYDEDVYYFYLNYKPLLYRYPYSANFSTDISHLYFGGSAYTCLQAAVSMGFSEIYLLGMDQTDLINITYDGNIMPNNRLQETSQKYISVTQDVDLANVSYMKVREYCDKHGIVIKNATNGRNLEIFERVDFDSLF